MKKRSGFVLVELLAVLAILGILLTVAVPLLRSLGLWQLRTASFELAARIREARQTAVAGGFTCRVVFYTAGRRYRVVLPDENTFFNLPEGISYAANNFPLDNNRPTVSFRFTGAPNRGGHVALRDASGRRMYVIVTPVTGRVRIDSQPP